MTGELDSIAALWAQSLEADEQADLDALAAQAVRTVKRRQVLDTLSLSAILIGIIVGLLVRPSTEGTVVGLILSATLGWYWHRRRVRDRLAFASIGESRGDFVMSKLAATTTDLRLSVWSLLLLLPTWLASLFFLQNLRTDALSLEGMRTVVVGVLDTPRGLFTLGALAALAAYLVVRCYRLRRERQALLDLSRSYAAEDQATGLLQTRNSSASW